MPGKNKIRVLFVAICVLIFQPISARAADDLSEAQKLYKEGDFQKAGQYLEAAIKENPKNATAHYLLGNVFSNLKRREDAIKEYQQADLADPVGTAGQYSRQALSALMKQQAVSALTKKAPAATDEDASSLRRSVKAISAETSESERNNEREFKQKTSEINRTADEQVSKLQQEMQERIAANGQAKYATRLFRNGTTRTFETYNPEEENAVVRNEYAPKIEAIQRDRERRIQEATEAYKARTLATEEQSTRLEQQYLDKRHLSGVKLNPAGTDRFTRTYETAGEASGSPVPVQAATKSLSQMSTKSTSKTQQSTTGTSSATSGTSAAKQNNSSPPSN